MKQCTKTMTGKHIWKVEKVPISGVNTFASGSSLFPTYETGFKVCYACGMYDDRPKREGKK